MMLNPLGQLPGRNEPCWCGSGRKYKACHARMDDRLLTLHAQGHEIPSHEMIKTPEQLQRIRDSAKINVAVLDEVGRQIHEGMPLRDIDKLVFDLTTEMGGSPAPLNYNGYPYSVCTSVNDQVCHGYPRSATLLKAGDIVNVDCSTNLHGYYSDSSRMYMIGETDAEKRRLVEVCHEAVYLGLEQVKPWNHLGDIAQAINDHAKQHGYTIVEEIGGHGVGVEFHEDPWVGYTGKAGTGMVLVPGMIFTIEPMMNAGTAAVCTHIENEWEIYTQDGKPSAQWELMVLVTEDGHEVLSW